MAVLPALSAGDVWGAALNAWLLTAHNADGTLKPDALPALLAGATQPTRYVGGTATGAPVAGTFAVGDFVIDRSGQVWICVTAGTPGTWTCATRSREQLARNTRGLLAENFQPWMCNNNAAPASQVVSGNLIGFSAGETVTSIVLANNVAAAGTAPTTARLGLADSTGKIVAVTGNIGAAANWGVGLIPFALSAPYTVPASGGYYICLLVNGAWGTTQPSLGYISNFQNFAGAYSSNAPAAFQWNGQTDLPAVNSSLTLTTPANGRVYYLGTA